MAYEALAFVRAIRNGGVLSYSAGSGTRTVPLDGLAAVLLAMDEDQRRLGNETAFVRAGAAPASQVPKAPALPVVHAAPAAKPLAHGKGFAAGVRTVLNIYLTGRSCQADFTDGDEAYALNATEMLVLIGCSRGAYQGNGFVFVAPIGHPESAHQVVLPVPPTIDPASIAAEDIGDYWGTMEWGPKRATLTLSSRGRGMGDCGSRTQWTYDGHGFVVTEFERQDKCGGPPGDFPAVYRVRVEAP